MIFPHLILQDFNLFLAEVLFYKLIFALQQHHFDVSIFLIKFFVLCFYCVSSIVIHLDLCPFHGSKSLQDFTYMSLNLLSDLYFFNMHTNQTLQSSILWCKIKGTAVVLLVFALHLFHCVYSFFQCTCVLFAKMSKTAFSVLCCLFCFFLCFVCFFCVCVLFFLDVQGEGIQEDPHFRTSSFHTSSSLPDLPALASQERSPSYSRNKPAGGDSWTVQRPLTAGLFQGAMNFLVFVPKGRQEFFSAAVPFPLTQHSEVKPHSR